MSNFFLSGLVGTRTLVATCALLVGVLGPLGAVETQLWEHSAAADFDKGTLKGLSLSSDGHLSPAPILKPVYDASTTFLWTVARDSKGILYAGGGGVGGAKAKLFAIDNQGRTRTLELDGMAVQAIAIDKQNRVYAATSPDGKVYRLDAGNGVGGGEPKVFYDPKAKYIWAMAFSKTGDLYVATGDGGEIHKVSESGQGSVFYRTEETNVRSLAVDANDNVIAGTDASGLVLRISPKGEGFVLYEAPKREITALAVAADGTIFAAGTGNKGAAAAAPAAQAAAPARQLQTSQGTISVAVPGARGAAPQNVAPAPAGVPGGSEVYRIQPDGYARRVWNHAGDVVYAMAFDGQNRLVLGTGNQGNVYRVDSPGVSTKLLNVAAAQVTAIAAGANGRLYLATGNIGQVYALGPELEPAGTYESDVLDARAFSNWGRVTFASAGQGAVEIETRSGNVDRAQKDWSPWSKLNGGRIASPAARFLQYRATLTGAEVSSITTAYEMKNVAPMVDIVEATRANYKFPAPAAAAASASPATLTLPAIGRKAAVANTSSDAGTAPAMSWAKGWIGARWQAGDENGDTLRFTLEIRGENETAWKPLRADLRERYYSWDSTAYPDGKYRVRVTASDAPSNTPEQALGAAAVSEAFLIDNTPPEISGISGVVNGNMIEVRFHAKDALNVLGKAEYSVNGGEWKVAEPTTGITDSEEHDYRFQTPKTAGEATIAVRISDVNENQAAAKTIVK